MLGFIFNKRVDAGVVPPAMASEMLTFFESAPNKSSATISSGAAANLCRTIVEQAQEIERLKSER